MALSILFPEMVGYANPGVQPVRSIGRGWAKRAGIVQRPPCMPVLGERIRSAHADLR